jgi:hypothetical protein
VWDGDVHAIAAVATEETQTAAATRLDEDLEALGARSRLDPRLLFELLGVSPSDFQLDGRLIDGAGLDVDVAGRDLDLEAYGTGRPKGLRPHRRLRGRRFGGRSSIFTST